MLTQPADASGQTLRRSRGGAKGKRNSNDPTTRADSSGDSFVLRYVMLLECTTPTISNYSSRAIEIFPILWHNCGQY